MAEQPWLIVGSTVRALALNAARHGHRVCAIDAFADRDTLDACAGRALRLRVAADWSIRAPALEAAVAQAARRFAPHGFRGIVAGSGLDGAPGLRALLARGAPLAGCSPEALARLRTPQAWTQLLEALRIAHPQTRFSPEGAGRGWLSKSAEGSGGWHVQRWRAGSRLPAGAYLQRRARGRPASVLFAAQAGAVRVLGWQWQRLDPCPALQWRYGGVLTAPDMPPRVQSAVAQALARIAAALPLRGVGSMDFLVDGDRAAVLEINPRPTASVALYPECDSFGLHVGSVALAQAPRRALSAAGAARGEAVLFAAAPLRVPGGFAWPAWCADLPARTTTFAPGDPVCTVHASAPSVRALRANLTRRQRALARDLARPGIPLQQRKGDT